MNRSELLDKAKEIVNGARQENYGKPEKNFANIATYWSVYLGRDIKAVDVAAMMILMKLARLENNPKHEDSWIDIAGYAANGAEIATYRNEVNDAFDKAFFDQYVTGELPDWANPIKVHTDMSPVECKELK